MVFNSCTPRLHAALLFAAALAAIPLTGQSQSIAVEAGYARPGLVDAAPGQIVTLSLRLSGRQAGDQLPPAPPLPSSYAGFAVRLRQTFPTDIVGVPIVSVKDLRSCSQAAPARCDVITALTVQIPYELTPNLPAATLPVNFARLEIDYQGAEVASVFLNPVSDRIHLLNTCDAVMDLPAACLPVVTHADGSLVSRQNPALQGEVIKLALVGLGNPVERVQSGFPGPGAAPLVDGVMLALDARSNGAPAPPPAALAIPAGDIRLRSGTVGIYDLTLTVPPMPADAAPCNGSVLSNLTISVARAASVGGAGICVRIPVPEPAN
jgi:uncharacterized protein (TIGR03437 family)